MQIPGKSHLQVLPTFPQTAHASTSDRAQPEPGQPTGGDGDRDQPSGPKSAGSAPRPDSPAATETPSERIMQLRRQLAEGTYRVEGSRIAVQMIDETAENNRILKQIDTNA